MYTLDANVFARNLDPNEPEYVICHALLEQFDQTATPIIVPTLVLAEVAGTISRTRHDPIRARLFADAIYVAVARRHSCTLVSLDRFALASVPLPS